MDLPPGPRAPAAWQTVGWTVRPAAFLRRVHERFGDPVTIRTYWTDEPTVLFSHPDPVREVFHLDPAIAPAGQSWEFLRPIAGPHSILLLDGEEHLRERRLMQGPFHGERMRAFAPMVAELARLREDDAAYLDAVVKEALRIRPALTIAPRLLREPVQIAGRTLSAGVQVAACIWLAC